ncbi:unnamed protein product, partial [Mesorhabditis belari]|uniref:L-aminoadipate-semialdehyde dehydrogenase-phosphopantetheinyl transferase n=1 Tax=Mesorhabditis belari TaxID=2138241 RepID=A0AAF3J9C2_9BILA
MNNSYLRWAINIRELERSVNFENFYRFAVQCVTEKEYEEHRKFVYKDDSLACLVSRLLARKFGAIATTSQWNRVDIQRTKRGKPFVNSPSTSQRFNISHQGDYVVLASDSQYEIGIDVMKIDEREDATADEHRQKMQRLFTQGEHSYMASRSGEFERWKAFYRIWTLKEAFLKATGEGLINDLKRVDFQVDERENEAQMKLGTSVRKDGILQEEFIFEEFHATIVKHMLNFYDVLKIQPEASFEEVKKAYFTFLRRVHPDKKHEEADPTSVTLATLIWNTLKDSTKRREYDLFIREQELRAKKGTIIEQVVIDAKDVEIEEYCRCGDQFLVRSSEAEQIVDRGVFECASCSLCLEMFTSPAADSSFGADENRIRRSTAKIVVLGESGVGKSSLCASLAGSLGENHSSTVGAKISLVRHAYRAGTVESRKELVSLWDIGGQAAHRQASAVFLDGAHGAILVHDLSNSKSEENLWQWMSLLDPETAKRTPQMARPLLSYIESAHIPILLIGTKADQAPNRIANKGERCPYERINVDCRRAIAPGSTNSIILARFFDSAIDRVTAPIADTKRRVFWPTS